MKIKGDKVIIETAEEAACFDSWAISPGPFECKHWEFEIFPGDTLYLPEDAPKLREAITPKEGDAVFYCDRDKSDGTSPVYHRKWTGYRRPYHQVVKANALTIGKTVGELRELLALCEETKEQEK